MTKRFSRPLVVCAISVCSLALTAFAQSPQPAVTPNQTITDTADSQILNMSTEATQFTLAPHLPVTPISSDDIDRASERLKTDVMPGPPIQKAALRSAESLRAMVAEAAERVPEVMDDEMQCLARAVYFESRGEPLIGQLGVAQVILNRSKDPRFPSSVCGVVHQRGTKSASGCQFTFACDRRSDQPPETLDWEIAKSVAFVALEDAWHDVTGKAIFFHAKRVSPQWRHRMEMTATHGQHVFYRP
ncbi:MAG: cell wall hydrolase [Magnetospirillum sp.]|jgi:spore germination cell wall hydrolase CwlJ-like protein|nr:cell wall hydrolase [Magnetospirillum sp.]